jgi:uncharacterized protein YrrD
VYKQRAGTGIEFRVIRFFFPGRKLRGRGGVFRMIRSINKVLGYHIHALDDDIGKVEDFYFDDHEWIIRYVVVDTGKWLPGRRVLISPLEFGEPNWNERRLPVSLSIEQIKNSPEVNTDLPVSRQNEVELVKHFGWVPYWEPLEAHLSMRPLDVFPEKTSKRSDERMEKEDEKNWDPHLRSLKEVTGYHIHASDGNKIGHVEELIADTAAWIIRYIIVDTGKWLLGKKVLLSPHWIEKLDEEAAMVHMDIPEEDIKGGPEFDPAKPVNREYETQLYDYYGRPTYWQQS